MTRQEDCGRTSPVEIDLARLRSAFADNEELLEQVIQMFREDYRSLLTDIRHAVEMADASALRAATHTLRGVTRQFTNDVAIDICRSIEADAGAGVTTGLDDRIDALENRLARVEDLLGQALASETL